MDRIHKILTLEQLAKFCADNKFYSFDSKENGYKLAVCVPGTFEVFEKSESTRGLLFTRFKVCHTELNRNGSYVSEDNMKKAMPSLKYRPVLGYIHQLEDGTWDFHAHDMELEEDENGEEKIVYLEQQIGAFTEEEPYLEYDEKLDKTYVIATAAIPEEYTKAADIIRAKNGSKVSCELCIDSFSYNAKEHYLELEDFYFTGVTALGKHFNGKEVQEGMLGSRLDIMDFSTENNSVYQNFSENNKLVEVLEKLNTTLSNLNKEIPEEGGIQVTKFEELLTKYNKTTEEITFDYEEMSDEELEAKFAEMFEEVEEITDTTEEVTEVEETEETVAEDNIIDNEINVNESDENVSITEENENIEIEPEKFQKIFELSHDDVRYALYQLLSPVEQADNEWYYINAVYDTYFVYESWSTNVIYGQKYTKDGDSIAFTEERFNLHKELLTDSEYAELQAMRSNYSSIQEKLNQYEAAELKAQKEVVFTKDVYAKYLETEEFVTLKNNIDNFSVEELNEKAELAFAKCVQRLGFSFNEKPVENANKPTRVNIPFSQKEDNPSRYGNLKFN